MTRTTKFMTMADFKRPKLELPNGANKLLLHSCCAPCSGEVMEAIQASGIDYTIFFNNPNIHPQKEYLIRKDENIRFAEQHGVPFIDADTRYSYGKELNGMLTHDVSIFPAAIRRAA